LVAFTQGTHLQDAAQVSIGRSVTLSEAPLAPTMRMMSCRP
jgi:hypothetical protein